MVRPADAERQQYKGGRIVGEGIISPDGWCINCNDALAVQLLLGQVDALRKQVGYLTGIPVSV